MISQGCCCGAMPRSWRSPSKGSAMPKGQRRCPRASRPTAQVAPGPLAELQWSLADAWRLPVLLRRPQRERDALLPRSRCVALAVRLSAGDEATRRPARWPRSPRCWRCRWTMPAGSSPRRGRSGGRRRRCRGLRDGRRRGCARRRAGCRMTKRCAARRLRDRACGRTTASLVAGHGRGHCDAAVHGLLPPRTAVRIGHRSQSGPSRRSPARGALGKTACMWLRVCRRKAGAGAPA